jgi:hypothetical protein
MHIHSQPVNLNATAIHSPTTVAAQKAAEVRSRLTKAALKLNEESDPFDSFTVGPESGGNPRREKRQDRPSGAKKLDAEEEESSGTILSLRA